MNKETHGAHGVGKTLLLIALSILIVAGVLLAFLAGSFDEIRYPRTYGKEVDAAATRLGVEPNMIFAIIKAESDFTETAVSSDAAIGLMQILPDTFLFDIRQHIGLEDAPSSVLFHAKENILAGTYYFSHWYNYFRDVYLIKDPTVEALAAYNAGISNVWKWLEDDALHDWDGLFVDKIPFAETREYVKKVLEYKEKYDELYGVGLLSNGKVPEAVAYQWAVTYGEKYRIDPRLVMAVVRAESSFDPKDLSPSGAKGLMQITKGTFADIKADLGLTKTYDDLFDPEFNIQCGTYYLHWIDERIDGMAEIVASYNVGLTQVEAWLADPKYSADGKTLIIENLPNDSARRYIGYVLSYYEEYTALFPMEDADT